MNLNGGMFQTRIRKRLGPQVIGNPDPNADCGKKDPEGKEQPIGFREKGIPFVILRGESVHEFL